MLRKFRVGAVLVLLSITASVLLYLRNPLPLQTLRNTGFDQFQRWQPRAYQPVPVRIIDIDEASLRRYGQWPWPRTRIAELVGRLQQAQAASIAFDIVFAEPDRTSPVAMLRDWNAPADTSRQLAQLPDHDAVLAQAMRGGKVVLGFALDQEVSSAQLPQLKANYVVLGAAPQPYLHAFARALASIDVLQDAASGNGAITFIPDADGIVRRVPLLVRQGEHMLPTLAAEALRVAQQAPNYLVRSGSQASTGLSEVRIGQAQIATTPQGEVWLHYSPPVPSRYIPAWQVLEGKVPPALLKNHILLVGTSAHGLMDLRFSPVAGAIPGVEMHAQLLEQILSGSSLSRPGWARSAEVLTIVLAGMLLGFITLSAGGMGSLLALLSMLALLAGGAWQAYSSGQVLLDPLLPGMALLLTFLVAAVSRHIVVEQHQRWVRLAFARYVSPNLLNYLIEHPDALVLSARRTQCSFIFTDLAGFTSLMEKLDPGQAAQRLNTYLDSMIAIAFKHEGTLDRIVGDAVAIMFSAPVTQADHQQRALACALDMHAFAARYLAELNAQGLEFCATRIGVHSGEVVVGNFGGAALFDYRALGDPVNTASRLEHANKQLGTLICVSEATLAGCAHIPARPIGRLRASGKSQELTIFEPAIEAPANDAAYRAAYALMREHAAGALAAFEQLATEYPDDPLVRLHVQRLRQGQQGDLIVLDEK